MSKLFILIADHLNRNDNGSRNRRLGNRSLHSQDTGNRNRGLQFGNISLIWEPEDNRVQHVHGRYVEPNAL